MPRKTYTDPVTGDTISRSEHITRLIQDQVIRTWWFLGFFTLTTAVAIIFTVVAFSKDVRTPIDWWNVWASWTAVIIEGLIGRYMTGQTRRDALIIRKMSAQADQNAQILEELHALLKEVKEMNHADAEQATADYEIDIDSNRKLEEVLDVLSEIQDQIDPWDEAWGEE